MKLTRSIDSELSSKNWVVFSLGTCGNDNKRKNDHKENKPKKNAKTFLVKSVFKSDRYIVLVTDLRRVWFEESSEKEIIKRAKDAGSGLDASEEIQVPNLLHLLSGILESQKDGVTYEFEIVKNKLKLNTLTDLGLVTLRWIFICAIIPLSSSPTSEGTLDGPAILYKHLMLPMINVTLGYMHQVDELVRIVKEKEDELLDVIEEKTSTKKRKTEHFDGDKLEENMRKKIALQIDRVKQKEFVPISEILADRRIRTLFKDVTENITSKQRAEEVPRSKTPETTSNSQLSIDLDSSQSIILEEDLSNWKLVDSKSFGASPNPKGTEVLSNENKHSQKATSKSAEKEETVPVQKELEKRQQIKDSQKKYDESLKKKKKKVCMIMANPKAARHVRQYEPSKVR
ncbi:13844_t:CDS:2 [Acaulospora morrowiae]|uniref:Non-homologous end-joining factor 1 n=1 Tax=Acaulospora morrowiae TaxID=94023 RepID=A0A9N9FTT1_9GLOM|nr:13844_t:CDS:2 [Acaulospora morrowiae]